MRTIWWNKDRVILIDQTKLPASLEYVECHDVHRIAQAIKRLEIRGAPAIGVAAAMGLALTANNTSTRSIDELVDQLDASADMLRATRPTAWNLFWAEERVMQAVYDFQKIRNGYDDGNGVADLKNLVVEKALSIVEEDIAANRAMGTHGASLIDDGDVVGTVCNAGWLATAGEYGTALGAIKVAKEQGKHVSVMALETRPVLQGARLTAWELQQEGITVRVIPDGAVGYCVSKGMIDKFFVGADRIVVMDGCHVFNKVGTYNAALAARQHCVPFYVVAPLSTFDFEHSLGEVKVEERDRSEVAEIGEKKIVPDGVGVFNPGFDVTPPSLVDGIVTERGILYPPYRISSVGLTR